MLILDAGADVTGGIATFVGMVISAIAAGITKAVLERRKNDRAMKSVPPTLPSGGPVTDDAETRRMPSGPELETAVERGLRQQLTEAREHHAALRDSLSGCRAKLADAEARASDADRMAARIRELELALESALSGNLPPQPVEPSERPTLPAPAYGRVVREEYEEAEPTPRQGTRWRGRG